MFKSVLVPAILAVAAAGIMFQFVKPAYDRIKLLVQENSEYDMALEQSQNVIAKRDELEGHYNSFSSEDMKKLSDALPEVLDAENLAVTVDQIAQDEQMIIESYELKPLSGGNNTTDTYQDFSAVSTVEVPYKEAKLTLDVTGDYENFLAFLNRLEKNLRLLDVENITLSVAGSEGSGGAFTYTLEFKTYYLQS